MVKEAVNIYGDNTHMGDKFEFKQVDIRNQNGQVFLGKFNNVMVQLSANGQEELASTLSSLKDAITKSQDLPDDKKQEQIEVLNSIGDEAAKDKPNKTLLKMLSEGIITTLKAIPDIAKAVAAATPVLSGLFK